MSPIPKSASPPSVIKWAKGLAIIQLVFATLLITFLFWMVDYTPQSEFGKGFLEGFQESLADEGITHYNYEMAGQASSLSLIGVAGSILTLMAIRGRSKKTALASIMILGLHVLLGLSVLSIPILSATIAALLLAEKSRMYLGFLKQH